MKTLLHIIASPRGDDSNTLKIAAPILERFREQHRDGRVDTLDLFAESLPPMTAPAASGKYQLLSGKDLDERTQRAWAPIVEHIERFKKADIVLISTPMWNFGMPYVLKHYFDVILQPRHTFRYTENGPEGLCKGKKAIVVSSRGGDYREGPAKAMDHLEASLKTMLGFIGIADPVFVSAQPMMGGGPEVAAQELAKAVAAAKKLVF